MKFVYILLGIAVYHFLLCKLMELSKRKVLFKNILITLLLSFLIPLIISIIIINAFDYKTYGFCVALSILYAKYFFNSILSNHEE